MSLMTRFTKFARSPQGRALADRAVRAAKDPKTRRQIERVGRQLMKSRRAKPR
jgi:hypothetical protein